VNIRSGPQMLEYETLADRVAGDAPANVLDWGCGWGQITKLLVDRGLHVQAYDFDAAATGTERRPLERFPGLEYTASSEPVKLPYGDGEFDAVISCGVLEHVPDPAASLRELHRILGPGGSLYVIKLPNRASYLEWIAKRAGLYYHGSLEHDTLYTPAIARSIVADAGFAVREVRLANMLPLTIDHPVVARLAAVIWRVNRLLARVPLLNRLATNVEVDARRHP
jgi:2-polyprenyl-3-methyl-5-hydroxy-6-metoxy-1,4-benzoquinol methylase